ncbi:MAG: VCBS repeat-containing protein [Planctomycetota bacterium]
MRHCITLGGLLACVMAAVAAERPVGFAGMEMYNFDSRIGLLSIADLDGDGRNDLLLANNRKAKIEILANRDPQAAREPIQVKEEIDNINVINYDSRFMVHEIPVTARIDSLRCADLDADNRMEIFFIGEPGGLHILRAATPFAFTEERAVDIPGAINARYGLQVLPLGPGEKPAVLVLAKDGLRIFRPDTDPGYSAPTVLPLPEDLVSSLQDMVVADLDGNGRPDLLFAIPAATRSLWVRFQTAAGDFGPFHLFNLDKFRGLGVHDVDGNGRAEIFYIQTVSGRLMVGEYEHGVPASADLFAPPVLYPYPSAEARERNLATGDLNGDGRTDIVVTEPKISAVSVYLQDRATAFDRFQVCPSLINATRILIGDLQPTPGNELAVFSADEKTAGICRLDPRGRVGFPIPLTLTGEPSMIGMGDMDGDGTPDLVYAAVNPEVAGQRLIRVRTAAGETVITPVNPIKADVDDIVVTDADRDGRNDLVVFVRHEKEFRVFLRTAEGFNEITAAKECNLGVIENVKRAQFAVGDMDGDGRPEMIIARNNFARLVTVDQGMFRVIEQVNAPRGGTVKAALPIDIDRTGTPELMLFDGTGNHLDILQRGADGAFAPIGTMDIEGLDPEGFLVEDLDSDGRADILVRGARQFGLLFRARPADGFTVRAMFETRIKDGSYGYAVPGDFTADGQAEVVLTETTNNLIEVLGLAGDTLTSLARFQVFERGPREDDGMGGRERGNSEPRELAFDDISGDGLPDLVAVIHDRVIVYIQE